MFDSFLKFAIIQRCFESIPILQVSCFKGAETIAGSAVTLGNAFSKTDAPDVFSSSSSEPLSYELDAHPIPPILRIVQDHKALVVHVHSSGSNL